MKLSQSDKRKLKQCHPDLAKVIYEAAKTTTVPFKILEVARSLETQRGNVKKGVSQTLRSRHLPSKDGLARAADVVPIDEKGKLIWAWPVYYRLAPIIKAAAKRVKVPIKWGGDWRSFKDGPHWQLPWKLYP